jgi:hypothetical protein
MATAGDIASAVDAFLHTTKRLVGADTPIPWADGRNEHEVVIHLPLEVNGEQSGAQLMIVGFPRSKELKFRAGVLMPGAICRLDYTDETHPNGLDAGAFGLPPIVRGPHYHSWRVNRTFCRGSGLPAKLHHAVPFDGSGRSFDALLRWFCADTGIESLPTNHRIELPRPDRLL